jgi:hypothetical protein
MARRLSIVFPLSDTAINLTRRAIRSQNGSLANVDVLLHFVEIHCGPELANKVREHQQAWLVQTRGQSFRKTMDRYFRSRENN